jgi:hypothetical protein
LEAELAVKRVKEKEGEKLTPENIDRVITLLNRTVPKPISKKEACQILNISYNTTRLAKIIEQREHEKTVDKKMRDAKRGKPASEQEIKDVIEWYLEGDTKADIANRLYRSITFVTGIIDSVGVPQRAAGQSYVKFEPLPEQCIADDFETGELVWSSRYQAIAEVMKPKGKTADGLSSVYQIYVLEKIEEVSPYFPHVQTGGFNANQPAYDLGRLRHLEKYGVNVRRAVRAVRNNNFE